jgi:methylmalonyl-CoA mutase N-terminal domain/subunit
MPDEKIVVDRYKDVLTRFETSSGIPVRKTYSSEDIQNMDYEQKLGMPGSHPYTRGIYPEMYSKMLWLKSVIVCEESPKATNERYKSLIKQGITGLRLLSDVPTSWGIDPDHPIGTYETASNGTPHWALCQLEESLDGIPLENVDLESAHGCVTAGFPFFCMLIALAEKRGVDIARVREIGRASCRERCRRLCRSRWSPYH